MKKSILLSALAMIVQSTNASYMLQIFNNTTYPVQAVVVFEKQPQQCSSIVFAMPPLSTVKQEMTCCIDVIKIRRTDSLALNPIDYEYQQTKTNEGACTDTTVTINLFSNDILKIE